ncbi:MAG: UDP-N-acetylglucosamine 2-epimerase (non-hydrolyzing) [Candidatus Gastranaerophilales bacterium]|nr:UDP-N-acetylglucosamine 2-epimerase (non-hydrolyzing) [Candidatus Gastranaerophilales bacterium]
MKKKIKAAIIFGTRPEAIKMAPLIIEFQKRSEIEPVVIVTAQHRQMLDSVLNLFHIKPDFDLNLMKENQNLWNLTSDILLSVKKILEEIKPDVVFVHGDTTTAFASSMSAFYAKIPIAHVEAGLRTFDKNYPFPEEINRVFADAVSDFHFCPTDNAASNIKASNIKTKNSIYKTGNTVIDALFYTVKNYNEKSDIDLDLNLDTILLTSHRRENFGLPLENICKAAIRIAEEHKNVQIVYPVHPNPNVKNTVEKYLKNKDRIKLIEPLDYAPFCALMKKSKLILTDSGGVQEEAPSLKVPVLVLRNETERPEAVISGGVRLVGSDIEKICNTVNLLLNDKNEYAKMTQAINPYGDGRAASRIADIIIQKLG